MYYVCCVHGFVRGIKLVQPTKKIFDCVPDVRTAMQFEGVAEADDFMVKECNYMGHYAILTAVGGGQP